MGQTLPVIQHQTARIATDHRNDRALQGWRRKVEAGMLVGSIAKGTRRPSQRIGAARQVGNKFKLHDRGV